MCHLVQGFMGEVYASFVFISVLWGTVVDKRCSTSCWAGTHHKQKLKGAAIPCGSTFACSSRQASWKEFRL